MKTRFILTDYLTAAMKRAKYKKLPEGGYGGRIPTLLGVLGFGTNLRECEQELRSTLEDWLLLGLKLGHPLPIIRGIDLNRMPRHESVESV